MTTFRDKLRDLIFFYKEELAKFQVGDGSEYESEDEVIDSVISDWFKREDQ